MFRQNNRIDVYIYGRYDDKTGIGIQTRVFIETLKEKVNLYFLDTRPGESDLTSLPKHVTLINEQDLYNKDLSRAFTIFTDVTSNGEHDNNYSKIKSSGIKAIVSIFDSTALPLSWVKIINSSFDMVIVSSAHLIPIYKRSGVVKPIYILPLMIDDLREILPTPKISDISETPYTFGCIAGLDNRKNVDKVVNCFIEAFGERMDVKLKLHLPYSNANMISSFTESISHYSNILVSAGFISKLDYAIFLSSIDELVLVSKAEGFSITPREALLLGKKVILSDNFAHHQICKETDCKCIPANIPVPALYESIGYSYFGLQYDIYPHDLVLQFLASYKNKNLQISKEAVRWAEQFLVKNLENVYCSFIGANGILPRFSTKDTMNETNFETTDVNLLLKYENIFSKKLITDSTRSTYYRPKVIAILHDGGFFSIFNRLISYMVHMLKDDPELLIIPDWRERRLIEYFGISTFESYCYSSDPETNIFLELFEPLKYSEYDSSIYHNDSLLSANSNIRIDFNEKEEPNLTYKNAYFLYKSKDFLIWRQTYHKTFKQYFSIKNHITDYVKEFCNKEFGNSFRIAVQVRHPSHAIEQVNDCVAGLEMYFKYIDNYVIKNNLNDYVIFVASDQQSVINSFKQHYKKVAFISDITRLSAEDDQKFNSLDKKEQFSAGHQIQHICANDPTKRGVHMAEEVLKDALIVAKCSVFFHVTSNVATAISYINPTLEMIYCE